MRFWRAAIVFVVVLFSGTTFAQVYNVAGTFTDLKDGKPLIGLTTLLTQQGSTTATNGGITDTSGNFFITNVSSGNYILKTKYIGYKDYEQVINVSSSNINIETIQLSKDVTTLSNVTIEGTPSPAQQKGDTTQYNANAFKTNPDASSEDLVNKMPGVTNTDGILKVNGEEVKKVLVDGKEFFGDDASATLKNLPVDIVDKIQIFDQGSEHSRFTGFNDGNANKSINIITKANKRNGTFGNAQGGNGSNDAFNQNYYIASLTLNTFKANRRLTLLALSNNINQQNFSFQDLSGLFGGGKIGGMGGGKSGGFGGANRMLGNNTGGLMGQQPGIATTHAAGINYSNEWGKLKYSGSYFMNYLNNNKQSTTDRTYFTDNDSNLVYNENSTSNYISFNNRFNTKLEYAFDSMNTIVFNPKINLQNLKTFSDATALTKIDSSVISNNVTHNTSNYDVYTASGSLDYRHKFFKKGRTISLNGIFDGNGRTGESTLETVVTNDSLVNDTTDQIGNLKTQGYTVSGTLSYTEPIGKDGQLLFSYTPSFTSNTSDKTAFNILNNGETQLLDTALTNKFNNTFTYHRGGIAYQYNKDKLNFTLETQYQQSILHGEQTYPLNAASTGLSTGLVDKTYIAVLPQAQFNYKFTDTRNIRFNYRSSMNAPSITQLQNVIDNTNPLLLTAGNPSLAPERSHNAFIRYGNANPAQNTGLFFVVGGTYTQDYIGKRTLVANDDTMLSEGIVLSRGSQLSYPVNFNHSISLRSFLTYTWSIKQIKSNLSAYTGVTYSNTPTIINSISNIADQYNITPGASLSTNFSQNFDATFGYNATYNLLQNSLPAQPNNRYFQHNASLKLNWITFKRLVLNTQVTQQFYNNLSDATQQSYTLWNAYAGYKMLKDKSLELRASVNDILNQNNNVTHTQTETYVEDTQTLSLKRYYMVSLIYTLKAFGGKTSGNPPSPSGGMPQH